MTVLAITDQLQSLELTSKGTFASNPLSGAQKFVTEKLGGTQLSPDAGGITGSLDAAAQATPTNRNALPQPPLGMADVQTQVTGRLKALTSLDLDTLTAAIPANPGVATFKDLDVTAAVNQAVTGLGAAITGSENFGNLQISTSESPVLAEFDAFLRNAQAFPARLLDALLTTFNTLLNKLAHPDDWLDTLSSEALTEIFQEQIQAIAGSLPPVAIRQGAAAIQQRSQQAIALATLLDGFAPATLSQDTITGLRQQVKGMGAQVEASDRTLALTLKRLEQFDLTTFTTTLAELPSNGGGQIEAIAQLFTQAETFVDGLNGRITQVTEQLQTLITQVQAFLQELLDKLDQVADTVVSSIKTHLDTAKTALAKVRDYIQQAIQTIRAFVDQAVAQVNDLVKPVKQAFNQVATTAVSGIDTLAATVQAQTATLRQGVREASDQLDQHLNRETMTTRIREVLGEVTGILESPGVTSAIAQAEQGIDQVVLALQQISLDPAFKLAVSKTQALENDLRAIDTATLGTAQKTALKVGVAILEEVDVPGIVTPELTAAFDDVLNPVVNIVDLMRAEVKQITDQVHVFEPGTLLQEFLQPYIDQFVAELSNYRPSVLLQPVKDLYNTLLDKLEVLNPAQLLDLLDDLYQKLLDVIEALSPQGLTAFLNKQLETIATTLETLPINELVERVMDAIGDVESLVNGLGIDEILNSQFWQTLTEILSINLKTQIQQVDYIKAEIVARLNQMDDAKLRAELATLRAAANAFASDPAADCTDAANRLAAAWDEHQQAIATLQTSWSAAQPQLNGVSPAPEFDFAYRDLRERLTDFHQRLTPAADLPAYTALQGFAEKVTTGPRSDAEAQRLRPTPSSFNHAKTVEVLRDRSDDDILTDFRRVIPNELEQQFFGPTRRILQKLDATLAQPRTVLNGIEDVIRQLAAAPSKIADTLRKLAFNLGDQLRQAITEVVRTIRSFDFNFINDLHRQIVAQIAALRPSYLVNAFHDVSDFTGGSLALLLGRLRAQNPKDGVSRFLLTQFTETERIKIATDGPATDALVITVLNRVLDNPNLYSPERFADVTLPEEALALRDRTVSLDPHDQVRFNRLLLETYYRDAIVLSLQSLFPYFQETLRKLYPEDLVREIDGVFEQILTAIRDLPKALADALNAEYQKVLAVFERVIENPIDRLFDELIRRLRGLQSELGIGLEDISDAYNRLLLAVPV